MTTKICAVRDRAIDAFGQPIFVAALGVAVRSFSDEINNPEGQMYKHPEDYDLYDLGEYDPETGTMKTKQPRMIAVGKDCAKAI